MCLNNPITIPTGQDGKNVTVAFASDSSGTGFSYTASEGLTYISFVSKVGAVATTDFTTWVKFQGTDGIDGSDGVSVSNVYISDGSTAIGGTVYTLNSVVIYLSDGSYVNAGVISLALTWTDITLINGWAAISGFTPQWATDGNWLYVRGKLDATGASNGTFANLPVTISSGKLITQTISDTKATAAVTVGAITFDGTANTMYVDNTYYSAAALSTWVLDTVGPVSITQ